MEQNAISIRPFIGAKDFGTSRSFYCDLGFEEIIISHNMSLFRTGKLGFYLQDYYAKEWIDNTMLFMEVENVKEFWGYLNTLKLTEKYATVKLTPIRMETWGQECFVHDPSGVLWHFGEFAS